MQTRLQIGQQIETQIVAITDSTIFLDLSAKSEGVLDKAELADENGNVNLKEGDKIKVYFAGEIHGEMRFTTKIAGQNVDKDMLENAYNNAIPVEGVVQSEIKGGFEVKIGSSRAFCPYSQMGFKTKEEPSYYVGKTLSFKIMEYKNDGKDILVSNRQIQEDLYNQGIQKLSSIITIDSVVDAKVESLEKFGAFVNIQGFKALLPISEISLDRVTDVAQVLKVGQELKVKVINADWEHKRVSVSLKALMADPWDTVQKDFAPGDKIDGQISRIADFGLFVNLAKGIDGLVHISELEDVSANTNLRKVYKVGQNMSVVIEKIDVQNKRISLVPATSKEQDQTAFKYLQNQDDDGETYNPFAALLKK